MQYLDTGWFGVLVTFIVVAFILLNIQRAKGRDDLFIRRIPGLNALDDAIGRATEMGRPVLMVPGIGTLDAVSVQAVTIFANVTETAVKFGTPIRLCCADAAVYTLAQEVIRDVYQTQGMIERMDAQSVQFVSDRQFAFAAGVQGIILREKVAAAFLLGAFYAESLIFAETCNSIGAIQIAGSTQVTQTPFFIAACDYVLIGDEFYAASAYITREPVLVGSLIGQDWGKLMILGMILSGSLVTAFEMVRPVTMVRLNEEATINGKTEAVVRYAQPSEVDRDGTLATRSDTIFYKLFNPGPTEAMLTVEREMAPQEAADTDEPPTEEAL